MSRLPRALALLPAVFAFGLYLVTCSPTINFLDSGELTTVAWTAGIAHPPGYPLYTILSSLFIHLPLGSPAWRMNLLSALFGALAAGLFTAVVADTVQGALAPRAMAPTRPAARTAARGGTGGSKGARRTPAAAPVVAPTAPTADLTASWSALAGGLAAGGLFACAVTVWNWATQAKMYSLHWAFVAVLFWLALRARRALQAESGARAPLTRRWPPGGWSRGVRLLHGLALLAGLSAANHSTTYLLLPGLAVLLLAPGRGWRGPWRVLLRHAGTLVAMGLLPLLLYLYLPIRSSMDPLMNWGSPGTWGDFWRHVTGWQFVGAYVGRDAGNLGTYLGDAAVFALNQFGPGLSLLLLVPLVAGLVYLWRTERALLAATVLTTLIVTIFTLNYQIREVVVYYVPAYMMALWWVGLGVAWGLDAARRAARLRPLLLRPAVPLVLGALLPLAALGVNWGAAGHANDVLEDRYVHNAFKNFAPNAVVLTNSWDLVSGAYYYQHVLGERPDLAILDVSLLKYPFYVQYVERALPAAIAGVHDLPNVIPGVRDVYAAYKDRDRTWVSTGTVPADLPALYPAVLNGVIDTNLGKRPVYTVFGQVAAGSDEATVLQAHQDRLVPDGFGYRISTGPADRATRDPGFDLTGLTSNRVPLDEVAYSVLWAYPAALQTTGSYLSGPTQSPAQQKVGATLLEQAQTLAPLGANPGSKPSLR